MTGIIIAARRQPSYSFLKKLAAENPGAVIVCADGGADIAEKNGISYDVAIGDGDSTKSDIEIKLQPEKDVTDTQAAADLLIKRGADEIYLTCCTGGRMDHTLSALSMLEYLSGRGIKTAAFDANNKIVFCEGPAKINIDRYEYKYVSLIPLDKKLTGVDMINFKYPLSDKTIDRAGSLTVSNEAYDGAIIKITSGAAYIIYSK